MENTKTIFNQTVDSFLNDLASKAPSPGGGAANGVFASLAISLVRKALVISVKYLDSPESIKAVENVLTTLEQTQSRLGELADEDSANFAEFMKAFKNKDDISKPGINLLVAPLEMLNISLSLTDVFLSLKPVIKAQIMSDYEMGIYYLYSTILANLANVKVNKQFMNPELKEHLKTNVFPLTLTKLDNLSQVIKESML